MDNSRAAEGVSERRDVALIRSVFLFSLVLLAILALVGLVFFGWPFARSVLVGGILANASFWLLQSDIRRLMDRVGSAGVRHEAVTRVEKTRFLFKFYARLAVVGLLLFSLASRMPINPIGLIVGIATVMCSVVIVGLSKGKGSLPSKV